VASAPAFPAAAPAPVAPPPPASPFGLPTVSLRAAEVTFRGGSPTLDAGDRRALEEVVRMHRQHGGRIKVVGVSPSVVQGGPSADRMLQGFGVALDRANAVSDELVRFGVNQMAIDVSTSMPSGRERGDPRRVEVYVEY